MAIFGDGNPSSSDYRNGSQFYYFSITSSHIEEPSWSDCLSFIECKATDILSSAMSYLTHLAIPDTLDISKLNQLTFSAQTNRRKIQFFVFEKTETGECNNHFTSELNLFETESEIGIPSQGFEVLIWQSRQFLKMLLKSKGISAKL